MLTASSFWAHQGLTWDLGCGKLGRLEQSRGPKRKVERGTAPGNSSTRGLVAFRADVPCFPRKQRLALPGPLALVLCTQDAGVCAGCKLSESCWKLSTRTPCRRQSRGPLGEIHELLGKGWGLPLSASCSTAQAVSAPSPCRYRGAASEGWGAVWPPPMGSVGGGCSILEAVWQGGQTVGGGAGLESSPSSTSAG